MKYLTFNELLHRRGKRINLSPIDSIRGNLNNKYHDNLFDPEIAVIEESFGIISPDFFLKTHDHYIVSDIGYREKVPSIQEFCECEIVEVVQEESFILGGDTNYYHWLINWLPRMFLYEKLNLKCRIIVNKNFSSTQMNIFKNIFPQYIDRLYKIKGYTRFEKIILPNFFLNPVHSPFAISSLRSKIFNMHYEHITNFKYSENIIISRSVAGKRRIVNEKDFYNRLRGCGFKIYVLEEMDFLDQVNLFYNSKKIISPHGAGLANLIFCSKNPEVIEIINEHYTKVFWGLGYLCGVEKYSMFRGEVLSMGDITPIHRDITIDIDSFFEKFLKK